MPFLSNRYALQLRHELKNTQAKILTPDEEDMRSLSAGGAKLGAIVLVTSSSEVSLVVSFASRHSIPLVVQGGGYSTIGASATHGSIVISMAAMRKILVDRASETVAVQGGANWAEVDQAAANEGLAVVGFTCSAVGVGGTTLGGGFGWLTGRHGLVIDNLVNVTMVLADGHIVTASVADHPDLFWAVRGAGQSFGVATEFTFRAHRQRSSIFGGLVYLSPDRLASIIEFLNRFDEQATGDEGLYFGFTTFPPAMPSTVIVALLFYNGSKTRGESFFAPLLTLDPIQNHTREMPYPEINTVLGPLATPGARHRVSGTAVNMPLDLQLMNEIYEDFDKMTRSFPRIEGSTILFELLPYSRVNEVPIDSTAYANRGKFHNVATTFCWKDPELDAKMARVERAMLRKIREHSGVANVAGHGVGLYANFVDHEADAKELFGENLPRLQGLKMKYDPKYMFQKWHNLLVPAHEN